MKLKQKDIIKFEKRKDFFQVMATTKDTLKEIKGCLHEIFQDVEVSILQKKQHIIEQGKILWLIDLISQKFTNFMELSFDLTHKTEYLGKILWNRIITAIVKDRIYDTIEFVDEFSDIIYPEDC